jgi:hypothetical protein
VFDNGGVNSLYQENGQFGVRGLFVLVHEARIASHIGNQYRRQPALDPVWPLLHHACDPT